MNELDKVLTNQLTDLQIKKKELEGRVRIIEDQIEQINYRLELRRFKENKDRICEILAKDLI